MSLVYGNYELNLSGAEYDILLQGMRDIALKRVANQMNGMQIYTLDEFKTNGIIGFSLIGDYSKTSVVGIGYRTSDLSRCWFVQTTGGKHAMFIDGQPGLLADLGFKYEASSRSVISPFNDNKIIVTF